ncbi:hypothetical protein [Sorangium sp. So ce1335]
MSRRSVVAAPGAVASLVPPGRHFDIPGSGPTAPFALGTALF